jgi:alpha-glucosidase
MNIKKQIALRLRTIRLERFIASLIYSWQRDRIERQYGKPKPREPMDMVRGDWIALK